MGRLWKMPVEDGEEIKRMDKEGYEHRFKKDGGVILHYSNRPFCCECCKPRDIMKTDNSYTEICPDCGQGNGSVWS